MSTSFATFYNAFRDLSVTGVTSLNTPPLSAPTAKLPLKWVDMGGAELGPFRAKVYDGWPILRCRVVVLMVPAGQDLTAQRWTDSITMMDTLNTAIKAMTAPCRGNLSWTMSLEPNLDDSGYFAVVATVEGEG